MSLTYAIGDVHGKRDLLEALLAAIRSDAGSRDLRIIFVGDIIDRGPESRQCVDLVIRTLADHPGSRLVLGNHEEFMLNVLDAQTPSDREIAAARWLPNGGTETLQSYGLEDTSDSQAIARHLTRLHSDHIAFLRKADWMVETDTHVFVHGGIDPGVPLTGQNPVTTRWIREKFLDYKGALPKIVVHGHTVTDSFLPELHANRIAIDTGAVRSGHLTCVVFDGTAEPRFITTDDHGAAIETGDIRPLVFA